MTWRLPTDPRDRFQTDCVVYVHPSPSFTPHPSPPSATQLASFRSFLATQKYAEYLPLPAEMSEVIQADFVKRRQESVGGDAITQEDLAFRMNASRYDFLNEFDSFDRGLTSRRLSGCWRCRRASRRDRKSVV